MWLFTLVHTLFSLSYNPMLYYNAACCHRGGSVHGLSDSSVGWSVCHDRGTQLGTRNHVLDGRSRSPMRMSNFEGKKGRTIGRRTYDCTCTVTGWHCTIISPPSSGSIGSIVNLYPSFLYRKNVACALSVGFVFYGAHRTRRSQYEARGAINCVKMNALHSWICTWNCCHQKPFFSPKWRNRPIVEPPGCSRTRWVSWKRSPEPLLD